MPGSSTESGSCALVTRTAVPQLAPGTALRSALIALDQSGGDALAVVDPETRIPLGILTLRDVLHRIALGALDLDEPVAAAMTGGILTLPAEATLHQASVMMIRRRVRHLVCVDAGGGFLGIVAQADLFAHPVARAGELVEAIAQAPDLPGLAAAAVDVRAFSARLLAEGLTAAALCQQISALNDLIGLRAIDLVAERHELPYVPWCWMLFGSEGRLEQTLATDQDNGIVFAAESAAQAAALRPAFLAFAGEVNRALDACGFPLCKGNIMAGNPDLCLSLAEWQRKFAQWVRVAEPQSVVNGTIFFDLRALSGDERLVAELRAVIFALVREQPPFLRALAQTSLDWQSPLGWASGFRYDDNQEFPHTVDLKAHGVRPFVDAARIWALEQGIPATNTVERLRAAAPGLRLSAEEIGAFVGALDQVQRLRLANQLQASDPAGANRVNPDRLNELDRQILKEAFRRVKYLQQLLEMRYLRSI